ncbi:MAG: elongation factor G [bacterium]|jgi:elongation factor G
MAKNNKIQKHNIAIVGRDTVGKTRLIRTLLELPKNASVEIEKTPEEEERGYTVYNHFYHVELLTHTINLIDTPGNTNFLPKVNTALYVSTGAVFVVSGRGISESSHRIWEAIIYNEKPRVIFMNMLDLPSANFEMTLHSIEETFEIHPIVISIPCYNDGELIGIIDVIKKKLLQGTGATAEWKSLSKNAIKEVELYHNRLIEQLTEIDDKLLESYINEQPISQEALEEALAHGVRTHRLTPILAGAARQEIGVTELDHFIENNFPAYEHSSSWIGTTSQENVDDYEERKPLNSEAFSGLVFKTLHNPKVGKLSCLLVASGSLKKGQKLINTSNGKKFQINRFDRLDGEKLVPLKEATAGDIVVLEKIKEVDTNQTICDAKKPIFFEPIPYAVPRCTYQIKFENKEEEKVIKGILEEVIAEDPSLRVHTNEETGELLLSGMGVLHLQLTKEHIQYAYDQEIIFDDPHVAYHETPTQKVQTESKYHKKLENIIHYGEVAIHLEPLPRGKGIEFENQVIGGVIPRHYIPSIETGIHEALKQGVLGEYPVVDVRVTLTSGAFHNVDSSEVAFREAGFLAVKKALHKAKSVLLEPIMKVEIDIPDHDIGKISKDLMSRRGKILGYDTNDFSALVTAEVPLSELQNYATTLREKTKGLGMFTMNMKNYSVLTSHLTARVLAEREKEL